MTTIDIWYGSCQKLAGNEEIVMGLFPGKFKKLAEKNAPTAQKAAGHKPYKDEVIKKNNLAPHILPPGDTSLGGWVKECWKSAGRGGRSR